MSGEGKSYDYLFKIVVIGEYGVGKSALIEQYTSGTFEPAYNPTVGSDFSIANIVLDTSRVKLQIWDTSGQERFREMRQSYIAQAQGVIIVFDVCDLTSYQKVLNWIQEARKLCNKDVNIILVGNKAESDTFADRVILCI